MLNKIFIMGRLTRGPGAAHDPDNGTAVASFSLAVDRDFKSQNRREKHGFHRCGRLAQHGGVRQPSTSPRAAWPLWRAACRSGTGRTRTATTAAARRWWPTMSISATPSATVPRGGDYAAPAASYSSPPPAVMPHLVGGTSSGLSEIDDEDGDLPF